MEIYFNKLEADILDQQLLFNKSATQLVEGMTLLNGNLEKGAGEIIKAQNQLYGLVVVQIALIVAVLLVMLLVALFMCLRSYMRPRGSDASDPGPGEDVC